MTDAIITEPRHDFAAKLRQPSLLSRVKQYIEWQRLLRSALSEGGIPPETPSWLAPFSINLDLTTACNYHCDHCIDLDILNSKARYAYEELMKSLENLINLGLRSVILIGGGEPTIYPKFGETVRLLKERGIQLGVVSNGSRNKVILDVAHCFSEKDWVRLSLDSGNNETFQRMHKPVKKIALEEICAWVPLIRERNPLLSVGFSFIIVWEAAESKSGVGIISNIEEIVPAVKLARDNRFSYISFKPFLVRYPDGTEIMDPSVMENFHRTIKRIRQAVDEAKKYETEKFRIVESTNLRLLLENRWQDFTRQPRTCHMQAWHQVLSPLGLFNCPAYRGIEKGRIVSKDAYNNPAKISQTQESVRKIIERFDASKECANITCLYNSANWWLEKAVLGELKPEDLEFLEEHNDYFF